MTDLETSKRRLLECYEHAAADLAMISEMLHRSGGDAALEEDANFLRKLVRVTKPAHIRAASADQVRAVWQIIELLGEERALS